MVGGLTAPFDQLQDTSGIARSPLYDLAELRRGQVMRTGAGHENTVGIEESQSHSIDLVVATDRALAAASIFGKSRRVENDHVCFIRRCFQSA